MKLKVLTPIEWIIAAAIVAIFAIMVIVAFKAGDSDEAMLLINPEYARAKAQVQMARELAEQNRLMREQMERNNRQ